KMGVMLDSRKFVAQQALLPRLVGEPAIRLVFAPVGNPSHLHDRLTTESPDVLLADEALLRADPAAMHRIRQRQPRLRGLLWCDEPTQGLLAEILGHRYDGFLLMRDPP